MNRELNIIRILEFYDIPELFIASDRIRTIYLVLLVSDEGGLLYIGVPISSFRLSNFLSGKIDLHSIYYEPEVLEFYQIDDFSTDKLQAKRTDFSELPKKFLPESGYFISPDDMIGRQEIVNEAIGLDTTIIHLSLSDKHGGYSIPASALGDMLNSFQTLVKYTYKKAIFQQKEKVRKQLDQQHNYQLRAFNSSVGSFRIHLSTQSDKELFGNTNIEYSLRIIDKLINDFDFEEKYLQLISNYRGHSLTAFKKLMDVIVLRGIKLKYEWFSPGENHVHSMIIDDNKAQSIISFFSKKSELGVEEKEFVGIVKQIDVDTGTWRILNSSDSKNYRGRTKFKNLLEGIIVDSDTYRFKCNEIMSQYPTREAEELSYELVDVEKINNYT